MSIQQTYGQQMEQGQKYFHVYCQQRFNFLLRCLRFDMSDREERKKIDHLAPIWEISEMFVENCKNKYSEYCTVDESPVPFQGRCPFRQFMQNKTAKYRIKAFCLVDSTMFYTSQMEIYARKQPEVPYKLSNSSADVVKRLTQPISHTGRNVTFDNWFKRVTLAEEIMKEHKITIVGTIRKKTRGEHLQNSSTVNKEKKNPASLHSEMELLYHISLRR